MANIKSFPNNQDVYIGAEDVMKWHHGRLSGVFGAEGNAAVQALTPAAMAVTVSDGTGWISNNNGDGVVWWVDNEAANGSKLQLAIDSADGVLNRIDRVIVEWETTNYVAYPEVKILKGTASSTATAPALTNNGTKRQISLARINVVAGSTAITASMITDERLDSSVCGIVTETAQADTTMVNAQILELIDNLEYSIGQVVSGGVPAHASTHASDSDDPITPESIGAAALDNFSRVKPNHASSYRVDITSSTTLTKNHAGRFVLVNSSNAVIITVPSDSDAGWDDYTEIEFCQWGSGSVTIQGASGVGIVSMDNAKTIAGQYGCCCLKKTGGSTWILAGALA